VFFVVFFLEVKKTTTTQVYKLPSFDFILSVSHRGDWLTTAKQSILNTRSQTLVVEVEKTRKFNAIRTMINNNNNNNNNNKNNGTLFDS